MGRGSQGRKNKRGFGLDPQILHRVFHTTYSAYFALHHDILLLSPTDCGLTLRHVLVTIDDAFGGKKADQRAQLLSPLVRWVAFLVSFFGHILGADRPAPRLS